MDVRPRDPQDATFTKRSANGGTEWIKLKPGMEKAAAFLETHRYAALVGGSHGLHQDGRHHGQRQGQGRLFGAAEHARTRWWPARRWNVPGNGISIPRPLVAGAVMALKLEGGHEGHRRAAHRQRVGAGRPEGLLVGEDIPADALGNTADPDQVGQSGQLKFSEKMRTLFIGEDSSQHVNNFLWAYNVDTRSWRASCRFRPAAIRPACMRWTRSTAGPTS